MERLLLRVLMMMKAFIKVIELSKEISEKISVVVNGKEIEATFNYKPITDENGKTSIVEVVIPEDLPENLPENEQGEDEIVFELNEVMEDVGKIVLQKSEESTENVEIELKTETDNVRVVHNGFGKFKIFFLCPEQHFLCFFFAHVSCFCCGITAQIIKSDSVIENCAELIMYGF